MGKIDDEPKREPRAKESGRMADGAAANPVEGRGGRRDGSLPDPPDTPLARPEDRVFERLRTKFRYLIEESRDGYVLLGMDGALVYGNATYCRMLGYSVEELPAMTYRDITPERWFAEDDRQFEAMQATGHSALYEKEYQRRDGTRIPVEIRSYLDRDADGTPVGMWSLVRDITKRKRAEAKIHRLNRVYAMHGGINAAIVRAPDRQSLFEDSCRLAVEAGRFRAAWIGELDEASGEVRLVASAGFFDGYLDNIRTTIRPEKHGLGPMGTALRENLGVICNDIENDEAFAPWREEALRRGYRSVAVFPLKQEGRIIGGFVQYAGEPGFFDEEELRLLGELASNISFACEFLAQESQRKRVEQALLKSESQLRALSARMESLREEERTRIAREIHDELGQMLTAIKMDLRWMEHHIDAFGDDPRLNPILDKLLTATELTDATIKSVQRIASELRPGLLDKLGLPATLEYEATQFEARTGTHCRVLLAGNLPVLPTDAATTYFRIFQEALTNVARHAEASEVKVEVFLKAGEYCLEIRDNGRGISAADVANSRSLGLLGMQERARLLGGEVSFEIREAGGTVVRVLIPVNPGDHKENP